MLPWKEDRDAESIERDVKLGIRVRDVLIDEIREEIIDMIDDLFSDLDYRVKDVGISEYAAEALHRVISEADEEGRLDEIIDNILTESETD